MAFKYIKDLAEKLTMLADDWLVFQPDAEEKVAYKIKQSNLPAVDDPTKLSKTDTADQSVESNVEFKKTVKALNFGETQEITITDATATSAITINQYTLRVVITLDATMTLDWEPSAINSAREITYDWKIKKNADVLIKMANTTNVVFQDVAPGGSNDPDGIDPFVDFIDVQVGSEFDITAKGRTGGKIMFGQGEFTAI